MDQALYQNHLGILREELLVALGCTEAHRHRLCRRQGAAAAGRNARALPGPVQRQHHQKREGRHRPQLRRYARHRRGGHPGHRGRRPGPGAGRAGDRDAGGYPDHPGTGEGGLLHLRAGGGRGQPVYRGGAGGRRTLRRDRDPGAPQQHHLHEEGRHGPAGQPPRPQLQKTERRSGPDAPQCGQHPGIRGHGENGGCGGAHRPPDRL